jgi:NhaP-type Na+/H+ or K+/H+ antiporter
MLLSWFLLVGVVLVVMAFASRWVTRMPLSFALVYLAVGYAIGPSGLKLVAVDLIRQAHGVEVLAEVAVLISLFGVGLRLRLPLQWRHWRVPIKLATLVMVLTIAGIAAAAHLLLGLDWAVAFLLGAVLAPTDPVLASDVQVQDAQDRDALRVALTAEGGLNDGAAYPAVLLSLMWLGGTPDPLRWLWQDALWGVAAAVALGAACGWLLSWLVTASRRAGQGLEFEEFLALGAIALSYGAALAIYCYGFITVFIAALVFAHRERATTRVDVAQAGQQRAPVGRAAAAVVDEAVGPGQAARGEVARAGSDVTPRLLTFTTQCERLAEVALVLLLGASLWMVQWSLAAVAFGAALMLVVRPVATWLVIRRRDMADRQRRLLAWFGVRGIGSVYYLAHVVGLLPAAAWMPEFVSAVLVTIALSVAAHGASATPLMGWLGRKRGNVKSGHSPASLK